MESAELRERIRGFMQETGRNIKETAEGAGLSRSTLSLYLDEKYSGNEQKVEAALEEYLNRMYGFKVSGSTEAAIIKRNFLFGSSDANEIVSTCGECRDFAKIGIITGLPGYGKTYTLRFFARQKRVAYVECSSSMSCQHLVKAIREELHIYGTGNSTYEQICAIREFFNTNKGWLLIIDEADKLMTRTTTKKMEILREIFDQTEVGLVLAGEPELVHQIVAQLPRFANRVEISHEMKGLTREEIAEYLEEYDVDAGALEIFQKRGTNRGSGSFRLLDRTLNNAIRIANRLGKTTITEEIVRDAAALTLL